MQSPEFDMKAQKTRRRSNTRTRGKHENWTPARNNYAHGNLVPEAEKREPENEVEHMVNKLTTSFSLNNFGLWGPKSVLMNSPKFLNATGIMNAFLVARNNSSVSARKFT